MQESPHTRNVILLPVVIGLAALALDLVTKNFYKNHALPQGSYIFGWLSFTPHQNFGLLGDLQIPIALLIAINTVAFGVLVYGIYRAWYKRAFCELSFLGLVTGGAIGNLYDRVAHGYVFDWILLFNTSIINLADIWITLGIVGYLVCLSTARAEIKTDKRV